MMTLAEMRESLGVNYSDLSFSYHGKRAGVTSIVEDGWPTFTSWFGNAMKEYHNVDAVIADKFFDGKSLADLLAEGVEFWF